jgi:hypothetical protein
MSNYTKLTSYDTKDALSTGDPLKRVKGTELDDEFDAISTAIATKADSASPSFSGTPTAPTASYGTDTTQLATTAFVKAALAAMYPVGSIYSNISDSTNPGTLLGFGTWVAITGRVVVGLDSGDTAFDTAGETGGSKDAIVVAHTHTTDSQGSGSFYAANRANGSPTGIFSNTGSTLSSSLSGGGLTGDILQVQAAAHSHTANSTGSSGTNANLQPYIVAYVWKRTA